MAKELPSPPRSGRTRPVQQLIIDTVEEATAKQRAKVVAKTAEQLDRFAEHLPVIEVWTRPGPGARRPRFSRDDIAAAAMRIADEEGFDAVSMRRIATELDAGTMTLYHYVRTKDELLTLVIDAFMGEVVVPPDQALPGNWRDAITLIARRTRDALLRHPWVLDISDDPAFGPNGVRHFDQTLQALSSLRLELEEKLEVISAVDELVFGYCLQFRNNQAGGHDSGGQMVAYVTELIATGHYPELQRLADERPMLETWERTWRTMTDPSRFDRTLGRLLDGIERDLLRRRR